MLAGLVAAMLPWWIRNAHAVGHFVPTTLQMGISLNDAWHAGADGSSDTSFAPAIEADEKLHPTLDADEPFEYRLDRRFRREALDWARRHAGRVAKLALVKMGRLWNLWPSDEGWLVRLATAAGYVPLMLLAAWGTWKSRSSGWKVALCWLPAAYLTALHVVFVSSIRYREPAMLALAVLAGAAIAARLRWRGWGARQT
jgi:hypothetical protein